MSKEKCMNKKLHPYYRTGIYGWIGEEVDDNDYIFCPICGELLGANYWDYQAENDGDNKCPKCKQELDYSEIYEFEDTCYYEQLVEMKNQKIADLEAKLSEKDKQLEKLKSENHALISDYAYQEADMFELTQKLAIQDQDKISFAVEQLTLFKNTIVNKMNNPYSLNIKHILSDFDNQIKQLKEMK